MTTHRLDEDPKERRNFDRMLELADGDRLKHVHIQLTIMHHVEPRPGTKKSLAILANDIAEVLDQRDQ